MKRKEFLVNSGLLATSAFAYPNYLFKKNNVNEVINIGVIGTGNRGKGLIKLIKNISNMDVIAICDIIPFRINEALKLFDKKPKSYINYLSLLENNDLDAVIISTPLSSHSKISIDSVQAGKHVYCEKLMAKGFNGTVNLVKAVKDSKITFQTGHQYHSSRLYTNVVDLIKGGKIGKVIAFDSQWNRNKSWRRSVEDPNLERQINWRLYREYSFGLLAELSAHQIDFVNWVLDDNPIKVAGFGGIDFYKDGREVYDNIKVIYEYKGGVKASYTCLSNNSKDGYKISIKGDLGSIDIYQDEAWFYSNINKVQIEEIDGVSGATKSWSGSQGQKLDFKHLSPTKQALTDFRNCIKENKEPLSNVFTGANVSYAVEMGITAMDTGNIVKWDSKKYIN
jgi:predicted dehydrogenase